MGTSIIVLSINKSTYLSWFKQKDLFNNYSLKAKWILFNNPCDKGKGTIQLYSWYLFCCQNLSITIVLITHIEICSKFSQQFNQQLYLIQSAKTSVISFFQSVTSNLIASFMLFRIKFSSIMVISSLVTLEWLNKMTGTSF